MFGGKNELIEGSRHWSMNKWNQKMKACQSLINFTLRRGQVIFIILLLIFFTFILILQQKGYFGSMNFNWFINHNPVTLALQSLMKWKLPSDVLDWVYGLCLKGCPENMSKLLFLVGVLSSTGAVAGALCHLGRSWAWVPQHLRNGRNFSMDGLVEKYGPGYAIVTGCTEGIGLAFAQGLARHFNLVLVARNQKKLQLRIQELKAINPHLNVRPVIADLSTSEGITTAVASLHNLIHRENIQISILINNAGLAEGGKFFQIDPKLLMQMSVVNFRSMYAITEQVLAHMKNRRTKSAIINLSSSTGVFVSPFLTIYSSTKHLIDIYTRTLAAENREKVDILSSRPFGVTTKMMKMGKGPLMITPEECVRSSLADLGKTDTSYTGFLHKLGATIFGQKTEKQRFQIYLEFWKKKILQ